MNKAELSAQIATETSPSRAGADDAMTSEFSTIDDALASGETVRIAGFGKSEFRCRTVSMNRRMNGNGKRSSPVSEKSTEPARRWTALRPVRWTPADSASMHEVDHQTYKRSVQGDVT